MSNLLLSDIYVEPKVDPRRQLAVVSGFGSIEAGYFGHGLKFEKCKNFQSALEILKLRSPTVLSALKVEAAKVARGVREDWLVSEGDKLLAVAQIVEDAGPDEEVLPITGFSICVDPVTGQTKPSPLDETWEDLDQDA